MTQVKTAISILMGMGILATDIAWLVVGTSYTYTAWLVLGIVIFIGSVVLFG
jgi:hypothetical protein